MPGPFTFAQPTRLRMPIPKWGSPYTSGQALLRMPEREQTVGSPGGYLPTGGFQEPPWGSGKTSPQQIPPQIVSSPFARPRGVPSDVYPGNEVIKRPANQPSAPGPTVSPGSSQPPEVTPFFKTLYDSIKNIDPEERENYLQTTLASIKTKLDRFEFRLARGVPLSAAQQQQYNSLKSAFNDVQKYINNPKAYDDFFAGTTPAQAQPIPSQQRYYTPSSFRVA